MFRIIKSGINPIHIRNALPAINQGVRSYATRVEISDTHKISPDAVAHHTSHSKDKDKSASRAGMEFTRAHPKDFSKDKLHLSLHDFLENEPQHPVMKSEVPGPISKKIIARMSKMLDVRHMVTVKDMDKSYGNYLVDVDGNSMLNLNVSTSVVMCGYNNPVLKELTLSRKTQDIFQNLSNRPNLYGYFPVSESLHFLQYILKRQKPPGLDKLVICKDPLETAMRMATKRQKRKLHQPTNDDIDTFSSSMVHFQSEIEKPLIASFLYKESRESIMMRKGLIQPTIPFPHLKYPLRLHVEENSRQEKLSLELLEKTIKTDRRIAAVVVQPVLIDRHASRSFYQGVREITKQNDILLIVDERYTAGGMTGTFYAHEQWNLSSPPDIVTFNNEVQGTGLFHRDNLRPPTTYKISRTDLLLTWQFATLLNIIEENQLMEKVKKAGESVRDGLHKLESRFPELIYNARGIGAICAIDCANDAIFKRVMAGMQREGIILGKTTKSSRTILIRPMMIFGEKHAAIFLEKFEQVLEKELSNYGD